MNTTQQDEDLKKTGGIETNTELVKETIQYFDHYRFPKDVKNYKQYFGFNIDRLMGIEDWQANISYPIGASIINSTFANMYDFGYEFGVIEDSFRKLLNQTFDYQNQGRSCLRNMIKEGLITGKAYCRTSITKDVKELKLFGKYTDTIVVKKPTIKYISKFNVFYDHNYSLEKSPYQIEREIMNGAAIIKKYDALFDDENKDDKAIMDKIRLIIKTKSEITDSNMDSNTGFSTYDYNPVRDILAYQQSIMNDISRSKGKAKKLKTLETAVGYFMPAGAGGISSETSKASFSTSNLFKFDSLKSYEVIEYEAEEKIDLWINGNHITQYDMYKKGVGRIREIEFNSVPGTSDSLGIMDMIGDLQSLLDSIWNGFIDNVKIQLTGMFLKKGNIDGIGAGSVMKFTKFGVINLKGDASLSRLEMGFNDFAPLNMVQFLEGFISKMVGVNDYQLGGQHKVERVADGIDFMRSQYKSKLAVMIDSIQTLMGNIARDWMMIYLTRFTEEEMKEKGITFKQGKDENGKLTSYINEVKLLDMLSEEAITFTYNALETIDMEADREKIMTLFQPLAQNGLVDEQALWDVGLGKKFETIWKNKENPRLAKQGKTPIEGQPSLDWAGKQTSQNVSNKYDNDIGFEGGNGELQPNQPPLNTYEKYNSATIAKTPGGAKLQKITNKLNTTDLTDRILL